MNYRHTKAAWPIPLVELQARRGQYKQREDWFLIVWSVFVFVALASYGPLTSKIESTKEEVDWVETLNSVGLLGLIAAFAVWLIISTRNRLKAHGLQCPKCEHLLNTHLAALAVATGRCGKCETVLVNDHPSDA